MQQVFGQKTGHDHPNAVVHVPGRVELAHAGIDERIAGAALRPGGKVPRALAPGDDLEAPLQVLAGDLRVVEEDVLVELPPAEFGEKLVDVAMARLARGRGRLRRQPHLPRPDFPEVQVRRQA